MQHEVQPLPVQNAREEPFEVPAEKPRVLLIEDNPDFRLLLATHLTQSGYEVEQLGSGFAFADYLAQRIEIPGACPDLVVSDVRMPGYGGMQILEGLHEAGWNPPVVMMTGFSDEKTTEEAMAKGAATVLSKPFSLDDLSDVLNSLIPQTD